MTKTLAIAALLVTSFNPAGAQNAPYPTKPVTIVTPAGPGGSIDLIARTMAKRMFEATGVAFVVENKPGANGTLALKHVATSAADGHTLLLTHSSPLTLAPSVTSNIGYKRSDFKPIAIAATSPIFLWASQKSGLKRLEDFKKADVVSTGKGFYGSLGVGGLTHLGAHAISSKLGISMTHVPYKTGQQIITDLRSNQISFTLLDFANGRSQMGEGGLVPIAVSSKERVSFAREVATLKEQKVDLTMNVDVYLLSPQATSPAVASRIRQLAEAAMNDAEMGQLLDRLYYVKAASSESEPATLAARIDEQANFYEGLAKSMGLTPN